MASSCALDAALAPRARLSFLLRPHCHNGISFRIIIADRGKTRPTNREESAGSGHVWIPAKSMRE